MTPREQLDQYLDSVKQRFRTIILTRAGAVASVALVALACAAIWVLYQDGFPTTGVIVSRIALITIVVGLLAVLAWPLRNWSAGRDAKEFERRLPDQDGRVQTYLDLKRRDATEGTTSPFLDLLAHDAYRRAEQRPVEDVAPNRHVFAAAAVGVIALGALAYLLVLGQGMWGYGARHLFLNADIPREVIPIRKVSVVPGDVTVRRNGNLAIQAQVDGFQPDMAHVFVKFAESERWERAAMQPLDNDRRQWTFKLFALRGPLQYYVAAEGVESDEHAVKVVDLPRIQRVRLTYDYPEWTGMPSKVEEEARDIEAVAGTRVKVEVFADAPLDSPTLTVNGSSHKLDADGKGNRGEMLIEEPGQYRISAMVADELIALTDDYDIDLLRDKQPVVEIEKPGRDWRATNIEEVPVRVRAEDDFRLQNVELRYAVNGGKWQSVKLDGNVKAANSNTMLRLEELASASPIKSEEGLLQPGDLVTYYAVAKDRSRAVQTDLFMVQVQPFERRFTQSQGGGGGGGGGGDEQGAISQRQREILLASWNLQRASTDANTERTPAQLRDNARMLSEMQTTLATQARTLSQRTRARMSPEDTRVKSFVDNLDKAADFMDPAAKDLSRFKLQDAIPAEQQALQHLLRAESAFRDIQIALQQDGGGGGGNQAQQDFTEMFELEMDLKKNQYETESQLAMEQTQEEVDEAVRKLKELAARQEKLAQQARQKQLQTEEQRWKQEQLRREAEDLRRRLAELAKQEQQRQAQNGSQSQRSQQSGGQQSGQPSGEPSEGEPGERSGEQGEESQSLQAALQSVERALEQMRNASNGQSDDREASSQSAQRASRNLRRALEQFDEGNEQQLASAMEELAQQAGRLAREQQQAEQKLWEKLTEAHQSGRPIRNALDRKTTQELAETKEKLAGQLAEMQREMREAAYAHRKNSPRATQELNNAINELDASGAQNRLQRSAEEIEAGRARYAAATEGLITEALTNLERNLRQGARVAANEQQRGENRQNPEAVLAEVGELRRQWQEMLERQAREGRAKDGSKQGQQPGSDGEDSRQASNNEGRGEPTDQADQNGQPSSNSSRGANTPGNETSGNNNGNNLNAWNALGGSWNRNPLDAPTGLQQRVDRAPTAAEQREAAAMADRLRSLSNRVDPSVLTRADQEMLRQVTDDVRRLQGDPLSQTAAMSRLAELLELAALGAIEKDRSNAPTRTAIPATDAPTYREAVADYYRRLGREREGTDAGGGS